jgi:hypothetical protein
VDKFRCFLKAAKLFFISGRNAEKQPGRAFAAIANASGSPEYFI